MIAIELYFKMTFDIKLVPVQKFWCLLFMHLFLSKVDFNSNKIDHRSWNTRQRHIHESGNDLLQLHTENHNLI